MFPTSLFCLTEYTCDAILHRLSYYIYSQRVPNKLDLISINRLLTDWCQLTNWGHAKHEILCGGESFEKLVLNTDFSSIHELITDTVNILMFLCVLRKLRKSSLFEKGIEKQSWVFQVKGHFGFSSPILKNGESLVTVSATISPLDSETLKHLKNYLMEQMFSMLCQIDCNTMEHWSGQPTGDS